MADVREDAPWAALWACLQALQRGARRLRHLSQEEPLLQARPDYPRARIGRSHADELRTVLDDVLARLAEAPGLVLEAFPRTGEAARGVATDEAPRAVAARLGALAAIAASVKDDAFRPPPPLPQHAPPYLAEAPTRDLAGSKAVLLSWGIEGAVSALQNALLAAANANGHPRRGGEQPDPGAV